jgi:uncharacterized protein
MMTARHPIPDAALDHHVAVLGKTGSGKSYAAQGIVERLIEKRRRVCVIDPTDRYWGLRLLADGKKPSGYDIAIFGGARGDLPLSAAHGAAITEVVGTTATPVIIATRLMTVGERTRFFTDFAEALLRKNEGPLHLVIDEAHLFAPQTKVASVESGKLLHATNNLVSLGRGIGLRIMLLSQRPAKLHKDSLTQVETLVAMRMLAPQDRDAVRAWINEWADEATGADMMSSLPSLPTGTAWVWSPELDVLHKGTFPQIAIFDSGQPLASNRKPPVLKAIDLAAVRGRLETVAKDAVANDPKALKAEIAKLKAERNSLTHAVTVAAEKTPKADPAPRREDAAMIIALRKALEAAMKFIVEINAKDFFKAGGEAIDKDKLEKVIADATQQATKLIEAHIDHRNKEIDSFRRQGQRLMARMKELLDKDVTIQVDVRHNEAFTISPPAPRPRSAASGDGSYTGAQRKILASLATWRALGHEMPSREMVAAIAGYPPSSGGFKNPLGALNSSGAISYPQPGFVSLQADGVHAVSPEDARAILVSNFSGAQRKIVAVLVDQGTRRREDVAADAGYPVDSGGFKNPLGALRTLGVLEYPASCQLVLSDWAQELLGGYDLRVAA